MKHRIKKGDEVIVIAGRAKGRRGAVMRVDEGKQQVLIENVNLVKKHQKPNPQQGLQGGIVEREQGLHISNVMPWNPVSKKGDRIGVKRLEDGSRVRIFRSNGEAVDI